MDSNVLMLAFLMALSIGLVIYSLMPRKSDERETVKRRLSGQRGVDETAQIKEQARKNATDQLVRKATPMLTRLIMPVSDQEQTNLRMKLMCAGYRHASAQTLFLASKSIIAVIGVIVGAVAGITTGQQLTMIVGAAAFGGGLGLLLPELWLSLAMSDRKQKIKHGLADTLDLLVVSVESGLALDAALKRVGDEMAPVHAELSEEMRIATAESSMGIPRSEALDNMARRTGVEEVRSLVSVITQAEKFGTSVARALRNQGETIRTKRRQAAEEKAQKTAVKLMIPLVIFIFPAMGIVLAGPAAINIIRTLQENPVGK